MATQLKYAPIPRPPQKPLLGNILDLDFNAPVQSLMAIAREQGPIFALNMMGRPLTVVSGFSLVDELCDEKRFDKSVRAALHKVRAVSGDGLFTAYTSEPNWSKAHNILLPNFGSRAMQGYFPMMLDVAEELMLKWQRLNAEDEIDVGRDMTALTLDTIGICGFGYRFNSFYREQFHPFVIAMVEALGIVMSERGLPFEERFNKRKRLKLQADAAAMNAIVDRIISDRKNEPGAGDGAKTDLLDYMLSGVDKKTGERLDDTNIRYQIITFLIAGHETTSGLLAFAVYFLLNNPAVLKRAYDEVDRVFGTDVSQKPTLKQVNALTYVGQILKESLRLWPTAPAFALLPYRDEVIGERYPLKARSQVMVLLPMLHRDRSVWGERAESFEPDNFSSEAEAARPLNAYKPFGNGQRACIGRQFALQEATLVIGMMLQRFELIDHERYALRLKETLTLKLEGLKIKVRPRVHPAASAFAPSVDPAAAYPPTAAPAQTNGASRVAAGVAERPRHGTPLLVLFGSNLGTAEEVARQIGETSRALGFEVRVGWLDDFVRALPTQGAVLIVCASYNGAPPDNAAAFYKWLQSGVPADSLCGVRYAVFGCGNRNWASTYQSVPRFLDDRLAAAGAQRLYARGEGDAQDDLDRDFQTWGRALWRSVAADFEVALERDASAANAPQYAVEIVAGPQPNAVAAAHGARPMRVVLNRELQAAGSSRSTRHLDVTLPAGVSYRAGDHLGVVPSNSPALVERVMRVFGFSAGTFVRLQATSARKSSLPLDRPIPVEVLLANYVELQQPATRKQILALAGCTECPISKPQLLALAGDDEGDAGAYKREIKAKGTSLLDLFEQFPACEVPFGTYLEMLPLMVPRYYSISSSPLALPGACSITVGVVRAEALSGRGTFEGVCSTHLARLPDGEEVNALVKESKSGFRLPENNERPIIMVGPGTGLAPFRAFLQERSARRESGARLGKALLFFGCRRPEEDFLYREELERYASDGIVDLEVAFSRSGDTKTYVQDVIARRGDDVWRMLNEDAVTYVCGDGSRMEPRRTSIVGQIIRR